MNKSKKVIKGPQKKKERKIIVSSKLWIAVSIVLVVALFGAVLFDKLYKRVLITIDDDKYYLEDLNYYIYNVELQYNYLSQIFGASYLDMVADEKTGLTNRDKARQEAINEALYNEILYKEAVSNGYSLTADEKATISDNVVSKLDSFPERMAKKNGFTNEYLTEALTKETIVDNYRNDKIDNFDIDYEAITEGINKDDYRRYDIEQLFISTKDTDEQGQTYDKSDKDKAKALEKIEGLKEKAATTNDWSTLIPKDENEELKFSESFFLENDTSKFEEDLKDIMVEMENGEISDIYEAENGYYIIKMINNDSTVSYDEAVDNAIKTADNETFSNYYIETILPQYNYDINEKAVNRLNIGQVTLVY